MRGNHWCRPQGETLQSAVCVQEVKTSRKRQLMQMVLPEPALPLSKELLAARRLLGRLPVKFRRVEDRSGRAIISLDTYIKRLEEAKYSQLGL